MSKIIAVVRLAPGQVAFYDELTGTHLTIGNPIAEIADHMNVARIKRAVMNKTLTLVQGSFNIENPVPDQAVEVEVKPKEVVKAQEIKKAVEKVVEPVEEPSIEVAEAIAPVEEVIDEIPAEGETIETEVELESKPKTKRKKKED